MARVQAGGGRRQVAGPVKQAILACRRHYIAAAALSAAGNLLYLTPTLFMLQVYDRVVPTGSLPTLAFLAGVAAAAYLTQGLLEWIRGRLLVKAGIKLDRLLAGPLLSAVLSRRSLTRVQRSEAVRELDAFRQTMSGAVMTLVFDAPWAPIYVAAAFLLSPWLGLLTLAAGALLVLLSWRSEQAMEAPVEQANVAAAEAYAKQGQMTAYAGEIRALGMRSALTARALADRAKVNDLQLTASFASGRHASLIKTVRLALQSVALGVGAALAIEGKLSAGAIMAASLLLSRALGPIEHLTHNWKQVIRARAAYRQLDAILGEAPAVQPTQLPAPSGAISLEDVTVTSAQGDRVVIAGVSAPIAAGEVVALAGLSGAGKSTLLSALAGALPLLRGAVRLDGAPIDGWEPERLAEHIGYLPQNFVLFAGTVKDNISRFAPALGVDPAEVDAKVVAVAQAIGAHDMILRLPDGYETAIGVNGTGLSAGQTQRIALARALYGDPRIVLLDEPFAHLDVEGVNALIGFIRRMKEEGRTVIFAAHQGDLLAIADKVMLMERGRLAKFGPVAFNGGAVRRLEEKAA